MTDNEDNRFTARAARYARVGARVGGVAAQMAGARLTGRSMGDAGQRRRAHHGAGLAQGPADEGRPVHGDHSRRAAAGIRRRSCSNLQANAPPMGAAFVKRRMQAELGPDWQHEFRRVRPASRGSRLARPGAQGDRARRRARSPASCNIPTCTRRSKPTSSSSTCCSRCAASSIRRRRHPRDRQGNRRARARGARLHPRGQARRALSRHARREDGSDVRVPGVAHGAVDRPPADARLARRRAAARVRRRAAGGAQPHRARHVPRLVASVHAPRRHPRRSAPRQLHGLPRRGRQGGGHQPARLRLHPHLPAEVRGGRGRSLPRPARRRRRPRRPCLRDLGLPRPQAAN